MFNSPHQIILSLTSVAPGVSSHLVESIFHQILTVVCDSTLLITDFLMITHILHISSQMRLKHWTRSSLSSLNISTAADIKLSESAAE